MVADFSGANVSIYDRDGRREKTLARPGKGQCEVLKPQTVTSAGNEIFVYDGSKSSLLKFDADGNCALDVWNRNTAPEGGLSVSGKFHYRMGYLAGELNKGQRGCVAFRTDAAGQRAILPFHCYTGETYQTCMLNGYFGFVDVLDDRVYMAFPIELKVRVFAKDAKLLTSFDVGGRSARRAQFDSDVFHNSTIEKWWGWRCRYTFVHGLAVLPGRIAVLIHEAGTPNPWHVETYSLDGKLLGSEEVGKDANPRDIAVILRGDHQSKIFLLVAEGLSLLSRDGSQYRLDTYDKVP